jgi:hypothetical protein
MSRAATAASKRAAFSVAAFVRTRRAPGDGPRRSARRVRGLPARGARARRGRCALRLPEIGGAGLFDRRFRRAAGGTQGDAQREARVGVIEQRVGGGSDVDRGACDLDRGRRLAASRQRLGAHAAPRDRRLQVVAGKGFALATQRFGFLQSSLGEERAAEKRGGARRVDAEALLAEPLVGGPQEALGRAGVALEQLDQSGEEVGLEQAMGDAELFDEAA